MNTTPTETTGTAIVDSTTTSTTEKPLGHHVWLTVKQAATHTAVSTDTIYTACERGELRHARLSGRRTIRFRSEWLDEWLEQHVREPLSA
jgi:excisionase family DNA binding protein